MTASYQKAKRPITIVIFGATGDLAQRKLLAALFDLYAKGCLPCFFRIVGLSFDPLTDKTYREFVEGVLERKKHGHKKKDIRLFLRRVFYQPGRLEDAFFYKTLAERLIIIDREFAQGCSDKLFYLAVRPALYEGLLRNLAYSGLTIPCGGEKGWTRVLVEKPFGKDIKAARRLDKLLGLLFREEQIFRIDHYLAKETLQNILMFRFSNELFEPLWNKTYIDKVEIRHWETLGLERRGLFYDELGALCDVGQNHLLQMLALISMEKPKHLEAGAIRRERAKVLRALYQPKRGELAKHLVRGQYEGYRQEQGVSSRSQTETYFLLKAFVDNERWRGVPFYLESGKRLGEKRGEIIVTFKGTKACLCLPEARAHSHRNLLTFEISPHEGIRLRFWAKRPGFSQQLEARELSFFYQEAGRVERMPDAYERLLFDCIRGDQTLFASTDEVMASWEFITPFILAKRLKLHRYKKGSQGPPARQKIKRKSKRLKK